MLLAQFRTKKLPNTLKTTKTFQNFSPFLDDYRYFAQVFAMFSSSLPKCFELHHLRHYNAKSFIFFCKVTRLPFPL